MQTHESSEMYLETIYILSEKSSTVRSLDVANYMNYSKPSVSRAVSLLKKNNMLTMDKNGYLHLTENGLAIAKKIYERHLVITDFFVKIGIDKETAVEDACKLEHVLSDQSFELLKKFTLNMK